MTTTIVFILIALLFTSVGVAVVVRKNRALATRHLAAFDQAMAVLPATEYIPRSILSEWQTSIADTVALTQGADLARFLSSEGATSRGNNSR